MSSSTFWVALAPSIVSMTMGLFRNGMLSVQPSSRESEFGAPLTRGGEP